MKNKTLLVSIFFFAVLPIKSCKEGFITQIYEEYKRARSQSEHSKKDNLEMNSNRSRQTRIEGRNKSASPRKGVTKNR